MADHDDDDDDDRKSDTTGGKDVSYQLVPSFVPTGKDTHERRPLSLPIEHTSIGWNCQTFRPAIAAVSKVSSSDSCFTVAAVRPLLSLRRFPPAADRVRAAAP